MKFNRNVPRTLIAGLFVAALAWAPLAAADYSDAEIESFTAALLDVQEIGQEWTQRMQQAESEEEIQGMREQAQNEMINAIETHGLTVDEYNEIATAAQNDPELAEDIQQRAME